MTSNEFSLVSSWIESDRYFVYRYRLACPTTHFVQFRVRVNDEGAIEEFQLEAFDQLIPCSLVNDVIREYNATL